MEDLRLLNQLFVDIFLCQHHVCAGISIEGKVPVPILKCMHKSKRRMDDRIGLQSSCVDPDAFHGLRQHPPEHIIANLADEGGLPAIILKH